MAIAPMEWPKPKNRYSDSNDTALYIRNKWDNIISNQVEHWPLTNAEKGVLASILEDTEHIVKATNVDFEPGMGPVIKEYYIEGFKFTTEEVGRKLLGILIPFMRANGMKIYFRLANKRDVYNVTTDLAKHLFKIKNEIMIAHYEEEFERFDKQLHKIINESSYPIYKTFNKNKLF